MSERTPGQLLDEASAWWSTSLIDIRPGEIGIGGHPIQELIGRLTFPEMIWLMLRGALPSTGQAKLLEAALVAGVDHGPHAPSIAISRMAVTCGLSLNGAMASAINVLDDVHGGAGQQCMELYQAIHKAQDGGVQDAVQVELAKFIAERGRIVPGFGHRFHPVDPRRDPLVGAVQAAADAGVVSGEHLAAALEIERQLAGVRSRPVPMNIDGATATIYGELGFAPELSRGLFCLSRSVGILAHAWEERSAGSRIKGPLPPPLLADHTGVPPRAVPPRGA